MTQLNLEATFFSLPMQRLTTYSICQRFSGGLEQAVEVELVQVEFGGTLLLCLLQAVVAFRDHHVLHACNGGQWIKMAPENNAEQ